MKRFSLFHFHALRSDSISLSCRKFGAAQNDGNCSHRSKSWPRHSHVSSLFFTGHRDPRIQFPPWNSTPYSLFNDSSPSPPPDPSCNCAGSRPPIFRRCPSCTWTFRVPPRAPAAPLSHNRTNTTAHPQNSLRPADSFCSKGSERTSCTASADIQLRACAPDIPRPACTAQSPDRNTLPAPLHSPAQTPLRNDAYAFPSARTSPVHPARSAAPSTPLVASDRSSLPSCPAGPLQEFRPRVRRTPSQSDSNQSQAAANSSAGGSPTPALAAALRARSSPPCRSTNSLQSPSLHQRRTSADSES